MFRLNLPQIFSVKNLKNVFGRRSRPVSSEPVVYTPVPNPWQEDLDKLVADRFKRTEGTAEEVQMTLEALAEAAEQAMLKKPVVNFGKPKRATDYTVPDMKVWWGESLSTWDPDMAKNVDSYDQKPQGRAHRRWFSR